MRSSDGEPRRPEAEDAWAPPEAARAVLFAVLRPRSAAAEPFEELAQLCSTAGIEVVGELSQMRKNPTPSHYLGRGKTEELGRLLASRGANLAVCDEELAPVQGRNLEKALGVRVLDRSELILSIFAERARSTQARLQVELAQRQYQLPRLRRLWTHLDRERGGTRTVGGMGERQIDIDRRLLGRRIQSLRRRLEEIEGRKQREITARRREFLVSLVGYTNAGKSTLMNRLTHADVLEEDRLFSTLDTRTRRWELGDARYVLLSDTVGFIRQIPVSLVASFHATLAEARQADLLLVVADVADALCEERLATVFGVLEEIGAGGKDFLPVLNKVDALGDRAVLPLLQKEFPGALPVSAKTGEGIDALEDRVREILDQATRETWLAVPHEHAALHARVRQLASVLEVRYENDCAWFRVKASPAVLQVLTAKGARVSEDRVREGR